MRLLRLAPFVVATCLCAAAPKKPEGPEVLVVADVTGDPALAQRPTKEKPVYFVMMGGAERPLGDAIAGERLPSRADVAKEVVAALTSQGYQQTALGGPRPSLAIIFTYGTANLSTMELTDTDAATGESTTSVLAFNQREIAQLVGADKASRRMLMSSEADQINQAARDDRVYIMIGAMDVEALVKKQKRLVWRTRISIDSRRHSLPDAMRVMLASAAPLFGTHTDLPVFVEDADRRKTEVKVGTPVVVEDPAAKAPAPTPASPKE